jgi:hypothetical protein
LGGGLRSMGHFFATFFQDPLDADPCFGGKKLALAICLTPPGHSLHLFRQMKRLALIGLGLALALAVLLLVYVAILPQFERTSIQLPSYCDGSFSEAEPPARLAYPLPRGMGAGIVVTKDRRIAVVASITHTPPYASDVYFIDEDDNRVLQTEHFPNDATMAGMNDGVVYLYNDKLGYFINAHTGEHEKNILTVDNYGGLSQSDRPILPGASSGVWYVETSAIVSSWSADGAVRLLSHAVMNAIARGCFVDGATGAVTKL